jgi:hypothetical protein
MQEDQGLLCNWQISELDKQQHFFSNGVKPILRANPKNKVFVIGIWES